MDNVALGNEISNKSIQHQFHHGWFWTSWENDIRIGRTFENGVLRFTWKTFGRQGASWWSWRTCSVLCPGFWAISLDKRKIGVCSYTILQFDIKGIPSVKCFSTFIWGCLISKGSKPSCFPATAFWTLSSIQ